jgi:hypothetical protein
MYHGSTLDLTLVRHYLGLNLLMDLVIQLKTRAKTLDLIQDCHFFFDLVHLRFATVLTQHELMLVLFNSIA